MLDLNATRSLKQRTSDELMRHLYLRYLVIVHVQPTSTQQTNVTSPSFITHQIHVPTCPRGFQLFDDQMSCTWKQPAAPIRPPPVHSVLVLGCLEQVSWPMRMRHESTGHVLSLGTASTVTCIMSPSSVFIMTCILDDAVCNGKVKVMMVRLWAGDGNGRACS